MDTVVSGRDARTGDRQCTDPDPPPCGPGSRIVVGVDGSASSINAVRWASHQCHITGARLQAVIGWDPRTFQAMDLASPGGEQEREARATLDITLDHALGRRADTVDVRVVQGAPAQVLLATAVGATLLVVGSRASAGLGRSSPGTVGDYILAHSPCPVVIVRLAQPRIDSGLQQNRAGQLEAWEYTMWPGHR